MEAIILHAHGKRISNFQKGLRYENIFAKNKVYDSGKNLDGDITDTNIILICIDGYKSMPLLQAIAQIKKRKHTLPVAVVDDFENESNKKMALMLGADAYFSRPLLFRTFSKSLKQLIAKRENNINDKWLRAFDVWLDLERRAAKRGQFEIPLRNKEFALLEFFIINKGKVLTRTDILEHVWDRNANFSSNTVDVHINRLRKKIDDPFDEKLIHTIYCVGYTFDKKQHAS